MIRTALVTTTVHVPTVLSLYRRLDPSVEFFVAVDEKTPPLDIELPLPGCHYVKGREWACSELIGWNTCGRRNIALLEALKWGADLIYTVNDDDIPFDGRSHFGLLRTLFSRSVVDPGNGEMFEFGALFRGIEVSSQTNWFDPGSLLVPPSRHRGFPAHIQSSLNCTPATDAKVGVAVGLLVGMPDVDATTRIENPTLRVHQTSKLLDAGVVVSPTTRTVFNSENTALLREFVPAFFHMPGVGRHDDIFASLVVQRVMRDRGYRVHLGQPYVWQERNPHNLLSDLKAEMFGLEHTVEFAEWLDQCVLDPSRPVVEMVRYLYNHVAMLSWMPEIAWRAGLAWCDDCEKVL